MASPPRDNKPLGGGEPVWGQRRVVPFLVVCALCLLAAAGYASYAVWRSRAAAPDIVAVPIARLESSATGQSPPALAPAVEVSPVGKAKAALAKPRGLSNQHPADRRDNKTLSTITEDVEEGAQVPGSSSANGTSRPRAYVLFRSTALGETYGRVSLAYLDAADNQRYVTPLQCDRVHFAAGRGLCLQAKRGVVTTYQAQLFDGEFHVLQTVALGGIPSRARLSADGRLAAMTVFVSGHSYAGTDFSTRTSVMDATDGRMLIEDFEELTVLREDVPFKATDFNFWGVTFSRDSNRFYATLATAGKFYLIEGDVASRRARVIHEGVECPSLSPDNTRLAFKRRVDVGDRLGRFVWRLYVLDLATRTETPLVGETRNVDDQVEWLDNDHIVYALPDDARRSSAATNSWVLATKGSAAPRLLASMAFSPAVVR